MDGATRAAPEIDVLLVEDDPGDVLLTKRALGDERVFRDLDVAADGEEALAHLRREGRHAGCSRPHLILLDLDLPRLGGHETLAEIKADPSLRTIPVVVLTSSDAPEDVRRAYDLQAAAFVKKPVDLDDFTRLVHSIRDFWLQSVRYYEP